MIVNPRYVDVPFDIEATSEGYQTGDIPGGNRLLGALPKFSDQIEVIPESDWKEIAMENQRRKFSAAWLISRIFNQSNEPSCTSNASGQAVEIVQGFQFGLANVIQVSPISLYVRVGSRSSGSSVDDNLEELQTRGILPLDNEANKARFKVVFPHTGYAKLPSGWEDSASHLMVMEAFTIHSLAEGVTANLLGYPVVYGRRGHAICGCDWVYDDEGVPWWVYANSWGKWGDAHARFSYGFGYDSRRVVSEGMDWAYAIRSVKISNFHIAV